VPGKFKALTSFDLCEGMQGNEPGRQIDVPYKLLEIYKENVLLVRLI
jgi:hypothetical protein